jgi:hypothetical protein
MNQSTHRSRRLIALACGLVLAAGAAAQKPTKGLTGGLETGTELVRLPGTPSGSLQVRECDACPVVRLEFDAGTRYFIGSEAVTYARFREAAEKRPAGLLVSYRLGTRTLTRLRLSAAGNEK